MSTFWCPNCETTFQQHALSEEGITCPHCQTQLEAAVKVADISTLGRFPTHDDVDRHAESPGRT